MSKNFQIDKYYSELENVENKLKRIRSEKGVKTITNVSSGSKLDSEVLASRFYASNTSSSSKDKPRPDSVSKSKLFTSNSRDFHTSMKDEAVRRLKIDPLIMEKDINVSRLDSRIANRVNQVQLSTNTTGAIHKYSNSSNKFDDEPIHPRTTTNAGAVDRSRFDEQLSQKFSEYETNINNRNSQYNSRVRSKYDPDLVKENCKEPSHATTEAPENPPLVSMHDEHMFIDQTNHLYNLNTNIKESATSTPVEQLISEIRKRDAVFRTVEDRFGRQKEGRDYCRLLEQSFRREALLNKIVSEFKKMSNIGIQDLDELYHFIKNE